jgi:hypothetical protein
MALPAQRAGAQPIHDWVKTYQRSWSDRFDRLDDVLEDLERNEEEAP